MWITGWRKIAFDGTSFCVMASRFPLGAGDVQVCVLSGQETNELAPFCCPSPHEEALPACSVMFPCYGVDWSGVWGHLHVGCVSSVWGQDGKKGWWWRGWNERWDFRCGFLLALSKRREKEGRRGGESLDIEDGKGLLQEAAIKWKPWWFHEELPTRIFQSDGF